MELLFYVVVLYHIVLFANAACSATWETDINGTLVLGGDKATCDDLQIFDTESRIKSIEGEIFMGMPALTQLYIRFIDVPVLPSAVFSAAPTIEILRVEDTSLELLSNGLFEGCSNVTTLILEGNSISHIEDSAFEGLSSLTYLELDRNDITSFHSKALSLLTTLEILDLNRNEIVSFPDAPVLNLPALKHLEVAINTITGISSGAFNNISQLTYLNLRAQNDLMTPTLVAQFQSIPYGVFANLPSLRIVIAENRALNCCELGGLYPLRPDAIEEEWTCHNFLGEFQVNSSQPFIDAGCSCFDGGSPYNYTCLVTCLHGGVVNDNNDGCICRDSESGDHCEFCTLPTPFCDIHNSARTCVDSTPFLACQECIEGYSLKEDGSCQVDCFNGGMVDEENEGCICRDSEFGDRCEFCTLPDPCCETSAFSGDCINSTSYTPCETCIEGYFVGDDGSCQIICLNGGIANGTHSGCVCRETEFGDHCEFCTLSSPLCTSISLLGICIDSTSYSTCDICIEGYAVSEKGNCIYECFNDGVANDNNDGCICRDSEFGERCEYCTQSASFCKTPTLLGTCINSTSFVTCEECNEGYFIDDDGSCQALSEGCAVGRRDQCFRCINERATMINGSCVCDSSCHAAPTCIEPKHCELRDIQSTCLQIDSISYMPCITCIPGYFLDQNQQCRSCGEITQESSFCEATNIGSCTPQGCECKFCECLPGHYNEGSGLICKDCVLGGHCRDKDSLETCSCDGQTIECKLEGCQSGFFNTPDNLTCRPYSAFSAASSCHDPLFLYYSDDGSFQSICNFGNCFDGFENKHPFGPCIKFEPCVSSNACLDGGDLKAQCTPIPTINSDGPYSCSCSEGYTFNGNTCTKCGIFEENCSMCQDTGCLICKTGFSDVSNNCRARCEVANCNQDICLGINSDIASCFECPEGFYSKVEPFVIETSALRLDEVTTCAPCSENCEVCSQGVSCDLCQEGYLLDNSGKCVTLSGCSEGSYPDVQNRVCINCHYLCKTCVGPSGLNCSNCIDEFEGIAISMIDNQCQEENIVEEDGASKTLYFLIIGGVAILVVVFIALVYYLTKKRKKDYGALPDGATPLEFILGKDKGQCQEDSSVNAYHAPELRSSTVSMLSPDNDCQNVGAAAQRPYTGVEAPVGLASGTYLDLEIDRYPIEQVGEYDGVDYCSDASCHTTNRSSTNSIGLNDYDSVISRIPAFDHNDLDDERYNDLDSQVFNQGDERYSELEGLNGTSNEDVRYVDLDREVLLHEEQPTGEYYEIPKELDYCGVAEENEYHEVAEEESSLL